MAAAATNSKTLLKKKNNEKKRQIGRCCSICGKKLKFTGKAKTL
jgi:hypothetical protein